MFRRVTSKARIRSICSKPKSTMVQCALGHGIVICEAHEISDVPIRLKIERGSATVFEGEMTTARMKRTLTELAEYLTRELDFPHGVFLMTGTCLVPGNQFTLQPNDVVHIQVGSLTIKNHVADLRG